MDCHSTCLSAWNKLFLRYTKGLNNRAFAWYLPHPLIVFLLSIFWFFYHYPTIQEVLFSWLRCSKCRDFYKLTCFEWCPKTSIAAVRQLSHRWGPGIRRRDLLFLTPILVPTKIAVNTGSGYFELGKLFLFLALSWQ